MTRLRLVKPVRVNYRLAGERFLRCVELRLIGGNEYTELDRDAGGAVQVAAYVGQFETEQQILVPLAEGEYERLK